jgi:diphosphomevalonate decarboxylase
MQSNSNPEKKYLEQALPAEAAKGAKGDLSWKSPSNIALVKYWGKHGLQLPNNPSLSFTLEQAVTTTSIHFEEKPTGGINLDFRFEGESNPAFGEKIVSLLQHLLPFFPFLEGLQLTIHSSNSFPHSSGIASSASSMSALVMALLDIEKQLGGVYSNEQQFLQKASFFARLASGSAARSVFPQASLWGNTTSFAEGSDYFAVGLSQKLHPVFKTYRDSILIISAGTKAVSSRAGHALMNNNPYAKARYAEAHANTAALLQVLQSGDLEQFIAITESEALQLHALMMCSQPSFILMQPHSLEAIAAVRNFRKESGIPLCFTLDAGPNLHLLYPDADREKVIPFINEQLSPLCQDGQWIDDAVGMGPVKL